MKTSEFRNLIREEVRRVLREGKPEEVKQQQEWYNTLS